MVALVAPSGAGKSTLLHTAGLLERPDAGDVILDGRACGRLSDDERTAIRRNDIGFVYQFHHLLPEFSALENIMMPQIIKGLPRSGGAQAAPMQLARLHADRQARRTTGRPSFRAASSSAWRSRAPSPTRRWCCWPTSRPATSTRPPPPMCSRRWRRWCRQSGLAALIATHNHELAAAWTAASRWRTARSSRSEPTVVSRRSHGEDCSADAQLATCAVTIS